MIKHLKNKLSTELENIFLWIPVLIGLGIIFFFQLPFDPNPKYAIFSIVITLSLSILVRKNYFHFILVFALFCFAIGYGSAQYRAISLDSPKITEKMDELWMEGDVSEISYFDDGQRIILENIYTDALLKYETPKRIRINTRSDISSVQIGDRVLVMASIMPPPEPIIPNGFDFAYYLYFKQIGAIGYATSKIRVIEESADKDSFAYFVNRIRKNIAERISSQMELPYSAIANGMLVGDASQINKSDFEIIRVSGIAHIIAISGMHIVTVVGMVFFTVRFLLSRISDLALKVNIKKVSAIVAIFISFVYLLISGSPVSAQRAFVMSALVLSAIILDRNSTPMRSIAISAIVILILTPEAILGASLQMSFAACVALIASFEVSKNFFSRRFGQSVYSKIFVYMSSVTFSTVVAGAATAPFIIFHFNQFSTYSILSNVVCVPLSDFFIMPFGMISMLLMPIGLDFITLAPMEWGLIAMFKYAKYISTLPNASFFVPSFTIVGMCAIVVGGLILCFLTTSLRFIGVVGIIFGALTMSGFQQPNIAIDKSGKFFVIKDENGEMLFSGKRISKFAKTAWMQNLGINKFQTTEGLKACDESGCMFKVNGSSIQIALKDSQPKCETVDLLINLSGADSKCVNASKIINKKSLESLGGHLIWLEKDGIKIKTVFENRPKRIWNS